MFFVRWEFSFEITSENCLFKKNLDKIINLICLLNFREVFRELFFKLIFFSCEFFLSLIFSSCSSQYFSEKFKFISSHSIWLKNSHQQKNQFIILLIFPFTWSCVTSTESGVGRWKLKKKILEGSERYSSQFYSYFLIDAKI